MEQIPDSISAQESLSQEIRSLSHYTALPGRLDRNAAMHRRAIQMAQYIRDTQEINDRTSHQANRLTKCGHYLHFRDYYQVDQVRLHRADFCMQHLLCPLCAGRRGAKFTEKYMERTEIILVKDPDLVPYLVTLTVKDGPDLRERYQHLNRSYRMMMEQRRNAKKGRGNANLEICKAAGGVGAYEFKRGEGSGLWHPHGHNMWLCHEAPDVEKLAREWYNITGDSYIVDVRQFSDDPVPGFLEVGRYALKFSSMDLPDNYEAAEVLSRRRLIQSFGNLYGVKIPDNLADEPLENQPYLDRLYIYHEKAQVYNFHPAQGEREIHDAVKNNQPGRGIYER